MRRGIIAMSAALLMTNVTPAYPQSEHVVNERPITMPLVATGGADGMGNSCTGMSEVVSFLREQSHMVSYEPVWRSRNAGTNTLQVGEMHEVSEILRSACQVFPGYRWERVANRYTVFPDEGAYSEILFPSVSVTNESLYKALYTKQLVKIRKHEGILLKPSRKQLDQWRDIHLSYDFEGGPMSHLLNCLSDSLGENVHWTIDFKKLGTARVPVGNRCVSRPYFRLYFQSLTGARLRSSRATLRAATIDDLKSMLEESSGGPQSKVAFDLARRYLAIGKRERADDLLKRAEDLTVSETGIWMLRYRALKSGFGYPSSADAFKPMLTQHLSFLADCPHHLRQGSLWWVLREYVRLGQSEQARNLIESVSEDERSWQLEAVRHYGDRFPDAPPVKSMPYVSNDSESVTSEYHPGAIERTGSMSMFLVETTIVRRARSGKSFKEPMKRVRFYSGSRGPSESHDETDQD